MTAMIDLYFVGRSLRAALAGGMLVIAAGCNEPAERLSYRPIEPDVMLQDSPFDPNAPFVYGLCAGDLIQVRFPSDPTLDVEARVRSDGKISVPYVGDVQAAGRAPTDVATEITAGLAGVLKDPATTLVVLEETGRRVFVGGEVLKPGIMRLTGRPTLSQILFAAGGPASTAFVEQVLVMRFKPNDGVYLLQASLPGILSGTEPDVRIEPEDVVHVPMSPIATVNQFVEQYINNIIPRAATFSFTTELYQQKVRIADNGSTAQPAITIDRTQ